MSTSPPSASMLVFQHRVERLVSMLMLLDPTPEAKALLVETRRLRTAVGSWAAIPPSPEVRTQMAASLADLEERMTALAAPIPSKIPSSGPAAYSMAPEGASRSVRRLSIAPGVTLTRPHRLDWRPFAMIEGITAKLLRRSEDSSYSAIIKMDPGAMLPAHRHMAPEEMFLLEGFALLGEVEARAGDHLVAAPGSVHEAFASPDGCTFLLMASEHDEIFATHSERDTLRPSP